ncbi:rhomboid domain-containing protein 2 [Pimephales promelas]|uniref:rhomboid domain-containing protein 2 n=1 Tax=Pimephales promelas TaxID=90988 RepID=UPI0019559E82|nr:rhomboid domain-containing protein 2 [Pimephales promelas]KAG1970289.1 rhomboid domain-containing protein [Pimephales promelas]
MLNTLKNLKQTFAGFAPDLELTFGIVFVIVLSCVFSFIPYYYDLSEHFFSLESSAVISGHVYKLFTYFLYHKNMIHFFLGAILMVFPCSGLERGIGTVRFLYRSLLLSSICGLLHVLLEPLLFSSSSRSSVNGFTPLALSVLGMITISSSMKKAYIMGISVPTASLPWIILIIITLFFPNTVFMCNVLAIITGILYGLGWFSLLEMSESRASVLDKKFPFRLLKQIPGVQFIPASAEERKKPLDFTDVPPGSYPVQAYAPVNGPAAGSLPNTFDGWPVSLYPQQQFTSPSPHTGVGTGHNHGHSHGHHHGHSHHTGGPWMPVSPYAQHQFRPPFNLAEQCLSELPQPGVPFTPQVSQSEAGVPGFPTNPLGTSVSFSS